MDLYPFGTTMYLSSLAGCAAATALARPNLVLAGAARTAMLLIGVLFSSPSDIQDAAQKWRDLGKDIKDYRNDLTAASLDLDDEKLKGMGKEEYEAAYKKFCEELDKCESANTGIGDGLDQVAKISFTTAAIILTGVITLGTVAAFTKITIALPAVNAGAQAVATGYAKLFVKALKKIVVQNGKVWKIAAIIAFGVATLMQMMVLSGKIKSPTDAPDFTQAAIEGLPQDPKATGSQPMSGYQSMPSMGGLF
ncbi:hypothetical protein [Streptosporangium sp. NBC_01756]|uniref:hypothetical protein n=1 Tax=Streptosporangium sp. NBC_01756 TaxID=2975950 RepID=UPI002DD9906C|nr:hypothetical protein [Streptosporangium sp. NBC_01756]WSC88869.1 hypothetical protein OIE48_12000 [Streptosporangium sp. NBC_01756]